MPKSVTSLPKQSSSALGVRKSVAQTSVHASSPSAGAGMTATNVCMHSGCRGHVATNAHRYDGVRYVAAAVRCRDPDGVVARRYVRRVDREAAVTGVVQRHHGSFCLAGLEADARVVVRVQGQRDGRELTVVVRREGQRNVGRTTADAARRRRNVHRRAHPVDHVDRAHVTEVAPGPGSSRSPLVPRRRRRS